MAPPDVPFGEDAFRAGKDHSVINVNALRKCGLVLVSNKKDWLSVNKRRFKAALNMNYFKELFRT